MLTDEQRKELWEFSALAEAVATEAVAADNRERIDVRGIALPFKRFGNYYYTVGWAAFYVSAICQIEPVHVSFETTPGVIQAFPVTALHVDLAAEAMPRLANADQPMLLFTDAERPKILDQPEMVFDARDNTRAGEAEAQA